MLRPSLIMEPHSAVGGWAPRPRYDSPASSMSTVPTSSTAHTATGPRMLGSTWRTTSANSPQPCIRHACR